MTDAQLEALVDNADHAYANGLLTQDEYTLTLISILMDYQS